MKSALRTSLLVAGIALVAACADTPTAPVATPRFNEAPVPTPPPSPGEGRGVIGSGTNAGQGPAQTNRPRPPQAELH